MFGIKNKGEKSAFWKGIALGIFAGAFLPDNLNPIVIVKRLFNR